MHSATLRSEAVWAGLISALPSLPEVDAFLTDERAGGTCLFVGKTRRWTRDKETQALLYETYEPMASAELSGMAKSVLTRWGAVRVVLLHRTGEVPVAHPSVIVGTACPHRAEAFEATRFLIDTLKETVPIWKTDIHP